MISGKKKLIGSAFFIFFVISENLCFASPVYGTKTHNHVNHSNKLGKTSSIATANSGATVGLQQYENNENKRIIAFISHGIHNRFQVIGQKIREVIGQGFLYSINNDQSGNHVFITPVGAVGDKIDLTFICDNDQAVDLSLVIKKGRSQSVIINKKQSSNNNITENYEQQIAADHLLEMMIRDKKSRYDVEILNKKLFYSFPSNDEPLNLSFIMDRKYGWAKNSLKGVRLLIKNHGSKTIWLSSKMMKDLFYEIKSIYIPQARLSGGESTFAYIIRYDNRFGQNGEIE